MDRFDLIPSKMQHSHSTSIDIENRTTIQEFTDESLSARYT